MNPYEQRQPSKRAVVDDWCMLVGTLIINFATLDEAMYVFLSRQLRSEKFARIAKAPFADRLKVMRERVFDASSLASPFAGFEARLKPVRDLRNHVAHGHFYVKYDKDPTQMVLHCGRAGISMTASMKNHR